MTQIFQKISRVFKKQNWTIVAVGFAITMLTAGIYIFKPAYLSLLEYKLYDVFIQKISSGKKTNTAVIVDIDDYSLERFGQWPWPRYRVALLLQKISMAGALAVGMDILFAEPDGTSPVVLQKALKKELHVDIGFSGIPEGLLDNDRLLATILHKGPYVLGYSFDFEKNDKINVTMIPPDLNAVEIKEPGAKPAHNYLFKASKLVPPLPVFLQGGTPAGFMNTLTDKDGVLRRTPLFISWQNKLYPQLSLATLLKAFNKKIPDPAIKVTCGGIESIKIGNTVIPLQSNGAMLLNYRGPGKTFPYISAGKILEDQVNQKELQGKIIFLGTSSAGLKDIRVSPLDQVFPGVEVHATIVDNILSSDFIHRPDWTPGLELFCILAWGFITTVLIGWTNAALTLPVTLVLGFGAWYGGLWTLDRLNIWVSPFFPIVVLVVNFSILTTQKYWFSERKKKFFRSAFSKYVSKTVVDQLAENPEKLSLEGEEKNISILFSDIRGFTTLSERLSPSQVTLLLHDYFTPVTRIIINNHGTHDKFIGDAVMCFWNAPVDVDDHEWFAIKAAIEMLDALDRLNKDFKKKFGICLAIGIGLHSGRCRVGNMGSADIFDYTIIGDNVNLASRLESLTKFYGVQLLVSETILKNCSHEMLTQELDLVRVKGKTEPVRIFTVYAGLKENMAQRRKEIEEYTKSLNLYRKKSFIKAEQYFSELTATYPEQKLYTIYRERCEFFIKNPPDINWDGVFTHTSK
ncbi:CHASE2 domain-containing protein [Desulfobacula phenolica]|uniref:Adenylate cyclase n=1 Tax=Desulfobacula phenolica TaxID=90732 RepID=A0A1H2HF17_9BACT|nr:adenylate/guanylate cyclase domain-containing protein [Desulfobacula phenolica]SDU30329.1 adenylate cyclase [Desulfobacula phenolica]